MGVQNIHGQPREKCKQHKQMCNRQSVYIKDIPQSIHLTKTLKTQANVYKTFLQWVWCAQQKLEQKSYSRMKIKYENKHIKHHIIKTNRTHSIKLTKINPTLIRIITYLKTQQQLKPSQKSPFFFIISTSIFKKRYGFSYFLQVFHDYSLDFLDFWVVVKFCDMCVQAWVGLFLLSLLE